MNTAGRTSDGFQNGLVGVHIVVSSNWVLILTDTMDYSIETPLPQIVELFQHVFILTVRLINAIRCFGWDSHSVTVAVASRPLTM